MNEEETFEWSMYSFTDNRANDIMVWKSGRFVNGVEIEEKPEIVYVISAETLYQLIEKSLACGNADILHITGNMFEIIYKISNDR